MEGSRKIILPPLVAALVLTGCGDVARADGEPMAEQPTFTRKVIWSEASLFDVKDGVLVKYLGDYSRQGEIVLPEEVKKIGKHAFRLSKKLREQAIGLLEKQSLTIPANVKIEKEAFYGCGPLEISLEEGREIVEKEAFRNCTCYHSQVHVKVPDSVRIISEAAFDIGYGGWLTVELGNGVEILEDYSLQGTYCAKLPSSIREVGTHALGDWGRIPDGLPEGVRYLERHFVDLIQGRLKVPASVRHMAIGAVSWEEGAQKMGYTVDPDNKNYRSDQYGWLYSKDGKKLYFAYSLNGEDITIPDSVEVVYKKGLVLQGENPIKVHGLSRVRCI